MPRLRFGITVSLDGYVAGPDQSPAEPLGKGGEDLHQWVIKLQSWREAHGLEGGVTGEDDRVMQESTANVGATIMGRNMFGGHPGPWDAAEPWAGWWGEAPPFRHPVFVLTHYPRETMRFENGTTFTFVTDGIESALEQARRAAGAKDVWIGGGAEAAGQYLAAGLVDEMELHVVPVLLGGGSRLFEGVGTSMHGLELVRVLHGDEVAHLRFEKRAS